MRKSSAKGAKAAVRNASISTLAELAKQVDRDTGTVSRWTRRSDWPFPRSGPWQRGTVPKILRWVADTLLTKEVDSDEPTGEDAADEYKALKKDKLRKEIRKLHAQAGIAETMESRELGRLLDAAEVEKTWAAIGAVVRNGFQNLPSQIVPLALSHGMPHEASAKFYEQVEEAVTSILRHLSQNEGEEQSDPEDDGDGEGEVLSVAVSEGAVDAERVGGE